MTLTSSGKLRGVDLLLERAQAVPSITILWKNVSIGQLFSCSAVCAGPQNEGPAAPLLGRRDRRNPRLLADDSPEEHLDVHVVLRSWEAQPFLVR